MFILKSYEVECSVMLYGPKTASVEWSPKASPDITTVFSHHTTELLGLLNKFIAKQYNPEILQRNITNK